jgi:hypothetical protein
VFHQNITPNHFFRFCVHIFELLDFVFFHSQDFRNPSLRRNKIEIYSYQSKIWSLTMEMRSLTGNDPHMPSAETCGLSGELPRRGSWSPQRRPGDEGLNEERGGVNMPKGGRWFGRCWFWNTEIGIVSWGSLLCKRRRTIEQQKTRKEITHTKTSISGTEWEPRPGRSKLMR